MTVAYRSSLTVATSAAASKDFALPADVQVGDLLILSATGSTQITGPTGWLPLLLPNTSMTSQTAPGGHWYRIRKADDPSTVTLTAPGTITWGGAVSAFSGVDKHNPFVSGVAANVQGNAGTFVSATPGKPGATVAIWLSLMNSSFGGALSAAGWTNAAGNGAADLFCHRYAAYGSPGTQSSPNGSIGSATAIPHIDQLLVLNPDSTVGFLAPLVEAGNTYLYTAPSNTLFRLYISTGAVTFDLRGWTVVAQSTAGTYKSYLLSKRATWADMMDNQSSNTSVARLATVVPAPTSNGTLYQSGWAYAGAGSDSLSAVAHAAQGEYAAATTLGFPLTSGVLNATKAMFVAAVARGSSGAVNQTISGTLVRREVQPVGGFTTGAQVVHSRVLDAPYTGTSSPAYSHTSDQTLTGTDYTVVLAMGAVPPAAPTLTSPGASANIDRASTNRFAWTFNDEAGDTQSAYELRYRVVGAPTWTTLTASTPNTFRDIAAGTFAGTGAVNYEWQVRTTDQGGAIGAWSGSSFFTATDLPAGPAITAPTNGATVGVNSVTLAWSNAAQDAYEVRSVADNAGSPNTGSILHTSGVVESAGARSYLVPLPMNGRVEHLQVRTRTGGLWSPWSSTMITASFTEPPVPTVAVLASDADAMTAVSVSNPLPTGTQPVVSYVEVWRRLTGSSGDGGRPLPQPTVTVAPNSTFYDRTVDHLADYEYRARAVGANGTSSWSAWAGGTTVPQTISDYGFGY